MSGVGSSAVPFFVCGSLTDESMDFVKQLGSALSFTSDMSRDVAIAWIYRRVSFAIQKSQAMAMLTLGELAGVLW